MGIGFSIFLLAVGAILAFAVHATVAGVDIHVVGWILMAAGALGLILTMAVFTPRRRRTITETRSVVDAGDRPSAARHMHLPAARTEVRGSIGPEPDDPAGTRPGTPAPRGHVPHSRSDSS